MSEYQQWGKFFDYEGHVTHEMLNNVYGSAGMFFKTWSEAEVHRINHGGMVYTIKNYHPSAFSHGRHLLPEAKKYIEGYYVSHPPKNEGNDKVYYLNRK